MRLCNHNRIDAGTYRALPILLERLPELVEKIVDALIESAPLLIDAG